jgi:omega-6 fatty acid desaturase (delta-12 desaturase)
MRRLEPASNPSPSVTAPLPIDDIVKHCNTYKGADTKRSLFQLTTTLVLFAVTCALMVYGYHTSFWITALLYLPAAGLLTRIFIFQHDCGHGSFMHSAKANNWIGRALGLLTFTPYDFWRRAHNMHHATSGDLDRRSIGGIDTITVREYQAMSKTKQRAYRLYRNPFVLLVFGTPYYTIIGQRLPFNSSFNFYDDYKTLSNESIWNSIMLTNLALVAFYGSLAFLIGWGPLLAVYLPIVTITAWLGGWLFYIQHQFEETYWEKNAEWNMHEAALLGSSYYHLPKILQWFTGNIGLHHIHHLCLKIPNYKLQECMDAYPELAEINKLTLWGSLDCLTLKLWDEDQNRLVPFTAA